MDWTSAGVRGLWAVWASPRSGVRSMKAAAEAARKYCRTGDDDMADTVVLLRRRPPLLRRGSRSLLDQARDHVRVGDERHVARLDLARLGIHPLRVEPFELGIDRPVVLRDQVPRGYVFPGRLRDRRAERAVV